jgi:DNA polymerase iota
LQVFLDVTDIVDFNLRLLPSNLSESFFVLSKDDPTHGFSFNVNKLAGHSFPAALSEIKLQRLDDREATLRLRLHLASHLAQHIRLQLEETQGYTCTVGVSTSKLLAKLVGNVNKPCAQTTLMPPYVAQGGESSGGVGSNVALFIDALEVGKIPDIGFKTANKLREFTLQRPQTNTGWHLHEDDVIRVCDVKAIPDVNAAILDRVLAGPGVSHGIGLYVWKLLHGIDTSEVSLARDIPKQISIEDSYGKVDTIEAATIEMVKLSKSLIKRMRIDLLERAQDPSPRWLARPRSLRLSTRPRWLPGDGGSTADSRAAYHTRISRTGPVPSFLFNVTESVDLLAERLVRETLLHLFRRLHSEKSGWNLSLINVAVTNMQETASEAKSGVGRDIEGMFRNQETALREWIAYDDEAMQDVQHEQMENDDKLSRNETYGSDPEVRGSEDILPSSTQLSQLSDDWIEDENSSFDEYSHCLHCGARMPLFAMAAHERFHTVLG